MRKEEVLAYLPEGPRKEAAERAAALITCFRCLDTHKEFKERNNFMWDWVDGNGSWDYIGCRLCTNHSWCGFAHMNHPRFNDIQVFHVNNHHVGDRAEQLVIMGSKIPVSVCPMPPLEPAVSLESTVSLEPSDSSDSSDSEEEKEEHPVWNMYKEVNVRYEQTTLDLDIEVGNIADKVYKGIMAYGGDLSSIAELVKGITLNIASSMSEINSCEEMFEKCKGDDVVFVLLRFEKKVSSNKIKVAGFFNSDKEAFLFLAQIMILKPGNKLSEKKCDELLDKSIQNRMNKMKLRLEL
jgi:hypothetical protein